MKKFLLTFLVSLAAVVAVGCTDARRSYLAQYANEADVICYSGGEIIFNQRSTGKIEASESGAGLFFRSKQTGKFVRTYADCIIIGD